jgi:hypothetical protein
MQLQSVTRKKKVLLSDHCKASWSPDNDMQNGPLLFLYCGPLAILSTSLNTLLSLFTPPAQHLPKFPQALLPLWPPFWILVLKAVSFVSDFIEN